jgi:hypothetical protein
MCNQKENSTCANHCAPLPNLLGKAAPGFSGPDGAFKQFAKSSIRSFKVGDTVPLFPPISVT